MLLLFYFDPYFDFDPFLGFDSSMNFEIVPDFHPFLDFCPFLEFDPLLVFRPYLDIDFCFCLHMSPFLSSIFFVTLEFSWILLRYMSILPWVWNLLIYATVAFREVPLLQLLLHDWEMVFCFFSYSWIANDHLGLKGCMREDQIAITPFSLLMRVHTSNYHSMECNSSLVKSNH